MNGQATVGIVIGLPDAGVWVLVIVGLLVLKVNAFLQYLDRMTFFHAAFLLCTEIAIEDS